MVEFASVNHYFQVTISMDNYEVNVLINIKTTYLIVYNLVFELISVIVIIIFLLPLLVFCFTFSQVNLEKFFTLLCINNDILENFGAFKARVLHLQEKN